MHAPIWQDQGEKPLADGSDRPWGSIGKVSHAVLSCRSAGGVKTRRPASRATSNHNINSAQIRDVDMSDSCSQLQRLLPTDIVYNHSQKGYSANTSFSADTYSYSTHVVVWGNIGSHRPAHPTVSTGPRGCCIDSFNASLTTKNKMVIITGGMNEQPQSVPVVSPIEEQ
jgi:hypothetical protein